MLSIISFSNLSLYSHRMAFDNHFCTHLISPMILQDFNANKDFSILFFIMEIELHMVFLFLQQNMNKFNLFFNRETIFNFFLFLIYYNNPYHESIYLDLKLFKLIFLQTLLMIYQKYI